jgi:hypothetical protein
MRKLSITCHCSCPYCNNNWTPSHLDAIRPTQFGNLETILLKTTFAVKSILSTASTSRLRRMIETCTSAFLVLRDLLLAYPTWIILLSWPAQHVCHSLSSSSCRIRSIPRRQHYQEMYSLITHDDVEELIVTGWWLIFWVWSSDLWRSGFRMWRPESAERRMY